MTKIILRNCKGLQDVVLLWNVPGAPTDVPAIGPACAGCPCLLCVTATRPGLWIGAALHRRAKIELTSVAVLFLFKPRHEVELPLLARVPCHLIFCLWSDLKQVPTHKWDRQTYFMLPNAFFFTNFPFCSIGCYIYQVLALWVKHYPELTPPIPMH